MATLASALLLIRVGGSSVSGQILISDYQLGSIGEYSLAGALIHRGFITGLSEPYGMALDGALRTAPAWNAPAGAVKNLTIVSTDTRLTGGRRGW